MAPKSIVPALVTLALLKSNVGVLSALASVRVPLFAIFKEPPSKVTAPLTFKDVFLSVPPISIEPAFTFTSPSIRPFPLFSTAIVPPFTVIPFLDAALESFVPVAVASLVNSSLPPFKISNFAVVAAAPIEPLAPISIIADEAAGASPAAARLASPDAALPIVMLVATNADSAPLPE